MNNIYNTKKYLLIEEDHINKKMCVISEFIDKYNALHVMENICENILLSKNGYNTNLKYYKYDEHNRPYAYYIEKPDRVDGLNIIHKYVDKGVFYNSTHHKKIKSFYICEKNEKYINLNNDMIDRANLFTFIEPFNKCIKQLSNKFHTLIED